MQAHLPHRNYYFDSSPLTWPLPPHRDFAAFLAVSPSCVQSKVYRIALLECQLGRMSPLSVPTSPLSVLFVQKPELLCNDGFMCKAASARTPSAGKNPVFRIDAAIRSASGARRTAPADTLHSAPAGLPCSTNWFSLFPPENSLFDQTNSLFRGVGNSKLKPHDISGLGGFDPAYSRPNPRNSLFFPC